MARLLALLALVSSAALADAQTAPVSEPARWALGVTLGEPTGFSAKRYLGGKDAFDINIDPIYGPGFRVGADYLWGLAQFLQDRSALDLNFYLGVGPFVGTLQGPCDGFGNWRYNCNGDIYAGARMPIGLEALFKRAPFTVGLEVAPGIAFAPGRVGFIFDVSLVGRVLLN